VQGHSALATDDDGDASRQDHARTSGVLFVSSATAAMLLKIPGRVAAPSWAAFRVMHHTGVLQSVRSATVAIKLLRVLHQHVQVAVQVQGDAKDWFWVMTATLLYTYVAACLFMIYMHLYYAAGFTTISDMLCR
jgi:hypothetical protein